MSAWTRGGDALNGWKRSPDGDIEQWGAGTYSDGQDVTLPIPFPTVFQSVSIEADPRQYLQLMEVPQSWPLNNTQFRTGCGTISSGGIVAPANLNCRWRAYGR
ncbi:gp53-like domain-containing protein [Escherichia coli]|uniref:gp53-like domain-containing protein n=1 Tax=Escherichia coli TaxID=562 RepID=UPI00403DE456